MAMQQSLEELANQAEVDPGYVRKLIDLGALGKEGGAERYSLSDARRVRLLRAWEEAGLPVESIMGLVRSGEAVHRLA